MEAVLSDTLLSFLGSALKAGTILVVINEIRGLLVVGPVLYAIYEACGSSTAVWLGICTLATTVLTVVVPVLIAKKARLALVAPRTI